MSEAIDGVTAKQGTAEYYGQWMQMIIQTHVMSNIIGFKCELPQLVSAFIRYVDAIHNGESVERLSALSKRDDILDINVFGGVSVRLFNLISWMIRKYNLNTKGKFLDFVAFPDNLLRTRNFGKKSFAEFRNFMMSEKAREYFYD